jgi:hypothetical protein
MRRMPPNQSLKLTAEVEVQTRSAQENESIVAGHSATPAKEGRDSEFDRQLSNYS